MLSRYCLKRNLLIAVLLGTVVAQFAMAFLLPRSEPLPEPVPPMPAIYIGPPEPSGLAPDVPANEPPLELPIERRSTWPHPRTGMEVKP